MYRTSEEYDRMAMLAIDILIDYGIKDFPLDIYSLCKKMQINVIPYSAFEKDQRKLLVKKSIDGFNIPRSTKYEATAFINDSFLFGTIQRKNHTVGHEIKHIVEEDKDDSEGDLCDYFSKYLRCPIPYVMHLGLTTKADIIAKFDISDEQAGYVLSGIENRKAKYGNGFFEYELNLLQHLLGEDFHKDDFRIIDKEKKEATFNDVNEDLTLIF